MAHEPRGFFVTGSGTEVGKTVVAAVLARTLKRAGFRVAVFKAAESGLDEAAEPDHEILRRAAGSSQSDDEIAPHRFGPPVSPHLGAELDRRAIECRALIDAARSAARGADRLVCEGVGGLLVPLASDYLVRDFAVELGLPAIVAAQPGLGTINHTLLTLEAARAAGLGVAAVVLTPWPAAAGAVERSNRDTIAALGQVRVEVLPRLHLSDPDSWPRLEL
jgi:dethiobiotin synthetase